MKGTEQSFYIGHRITLQVKPTLAPCSIINKEIILTLVIFIARWHIYFH